MNLIAAVGICIYLYKDLPENNETGATTASEADIYYIKELGMKVFSLVYSNNDLLVVCVPIEKLKRSKDTP